MGYKIWWHGYYVLYIQSPQDETGKFVAINQGLWLHFKNNVGVKLVKCS